MITLSIIGPTLLLQTTPAMQPSASVQAFHIPYRAPFLASAPSLPIKGDPASDPLQAPFASSQHDAHVARQLIAPLHSNRRFLGMSSYFSENPVNNLLWLKATSSTQKPHKHSFLTPSVNEAMSRSERREEAKILPEDTLIYDAKITRESPGETAIAKRQAFHQLVNMLKSVQQRIALNGDPARLEMRLWRSLDTINYGLPEEYRIIFSKEGEKEARLEMMRDMLEFFREHEELISQQLSLRSLKSISVMLISAINRRS